MRMIYKTNKTPMVGEISDYEEEVLLHKVDETKWEKTWNELVRKYHYLGYGSVIGARMKYIITLGAYIVGAISFCSAAYHLGPRDEYIGWDEETRLAMLPHLLSNNRFLILPWISIRNLASRVLSLSLQRLRKDWEKQYGITPYMVETFVDNAYQGTCYKAANWTYLGLTKGYKKIGKTFVYHGRKKAIYVYIMDRQFAREFKPDTGRLKQFTKERKETSLLKEKREELTAMMSGIPMWFPSLLKLVGIAYDPTEKIKEHFIGHTERYIPFLGRKEHKQHMVTMLQGLLSDLPRKTIEPIAIAFRGIGSVRNMTQFMTKCKWDERGMLAEYQSDLSETIAAGDGMITGDETGIPKKGNASVGVARQYCGSVGKVTNSQVGVMAGYASSKGYGLVDYKLYMPERWFEDGYAARRKKCGVPSKTKFRTKNEILLNMINNISCSGKFPAKYIGVDCAYGNDDNFLDSLPDNLIYFADIPGERRVFTNRPNVSIPAYSGKGRKPAKEKPEFPPLAVKKVVEESNTPYTRVVLGIGAKGPVIAEEKCLLVVEERDELPGKDIWLYARKLANGTIKYALCNASSDAHIDDIRKPALMRWSIEQCFNECKEYLGMDQYETRSWDAWSRHILLILIAHLFIIKLRIAFSSIPRTPSPTPHIDTPVTFEEYLEAHEKMLCDEPINHPDIMLKPTNPQQFLTIGLIQKLICYSFVKSGVVLEEINYLLHNSWKAFCSHSTKRMHDEMQALNNV